MKLYVIVLPVVLVLGLCNANHIKQRTNKSYHLSAEAKLRMHLMAIYDDLNLKRDLRPLYDSKSRVNVSMGVSLKNLISVDEKSRTVALQLWEVYAWKDEYLKWDPEDFGQHSRIELRSQDVWIPDIKLYQGFDPDSNRINAEMVDVQSDGTVVFYPVFTRHMTCKEKGKTLECVLQYGSWIYDGQQVDINFRGGVKNISVWDYNEHPDYELVFQDAVKEVTETACCTYPRLTFRLIFKRKSNWW